MITKTGRVRITRNERAAVLRRLLGDADVRYDSVDIWVAGRLVREGLAVIRTMGDEGQVTGIAVPGKTWYLQATADGEAYLRSHEDMMREKEAEARRARQA